MRTTSMFRLAGYVFTYDRATRQARVRIDMWREDPETRERYWVTVATCAPDRASARSVALALAAWVRACDVGPRRDARALAVAESFALLRDRLAVTAPEARASVSARPVVMRLPVTPPGARGDTRGAAA